MILQALKAYYDRKAADPDSGIAPLGWERKEIPYLFVLDREGHLVNIEDTQELVGKKLRAKTFLVPQSVKRTVGIEPYFLWDNAEYVTGILCKANGKPERVAQQHAAFIERLIPYAELAPVRAVLTFLTSPNLAEALANCPAWQKAKEECAFMAFRFADASGLLFEEDCVRKVVNQMANTQAAATIVDLITGEPGPLAILHPAIKGIAGANTTGANIVSFNFAAATSFGKEQGANAPVSAPSAFAYTTALNTLLGKDSHQKLTVGDATMIFWSEKADAFEESLLGFLDEPPKDNPDALVEHVRTLFTSPKTGVATFAEDATRFYVLGLAPNAARIAIRFWQVGTVAEMADRFREYFADLQICHGPKEKEHLPIKWLLVATAAQGKFDNIVPNLAGEVMRSILAGLPFPETLLQALLQRIKADHAISYPRAKLIKGFLIRKWRFANSNHERNISVSLDPDNTATGYRLGRLFAILERIQEDANPGLNATIKDRFYAAASATPVAVFGNLIRLTQHHLAKLRKEKPGLGVVREKAMQEILAGVNAFPAHLSLEDQGLFALGYYHQRQALFTKQDAE